MTIDLVERIVAIVSETVTAVAVVAGGIWAYQKYNRYERHSIFAQAISAVDINIESKVLLGQTDKDCILTLVAKIINHGKVSSLIDLDRSYFVVETFQNMVTNPDAIIARSSDVILLKPDSVLDFQVGRYFVALGGLTGPCVLRPTYPAPI